VSEVGTFVWTLGGSLSFAALGGAFGAVAAWKSERTAGSPLATRLAGLLGELLGRRWQPRQTGTVAGGIDGAIFLGLIGTALGLAAAGLRVEPARWLLPVFVFLALTALGAVLFGLLASEMIRQRVGAILGVFLGGVGGAFLAAQFWGVRHIVPGAALGMALVIGLHWLLLPRSE